MSFHRPRTAALLAGPAAVALAVVLSACAGASSGPATPATSATSSASSATAASSPVTSSGTPTTPEPATSSPAAAQGQLVEVTVAGKKVTGPGRVKVKLGSKVTLRVTSDVADEVHLHGYDKHVDVEKGGTADLTFTADVPGVFEVELESRALQLVRLQVQ